LYNKKLFEQDVEAAAGMPCGCFVFFVCFLKNFLRFSYGCNRMKLLSGGKWYKVVQNGIDVVSKRFTSGCIADNG
jgi:hypothetical protein